ncbi:hypothetical protein Tco_0706928 [Tanacetum coccineum]|uniref:F-box domain-containing protein n=1 Tax=Tanacetum coccineum TaxID=301880 RepID=A0ABQ4Y9N5_9ASTR
MSKNQVNHAGDNYEQPHSVLTNDDLLTEILIRLPILCIYLFTSVSKQWRRILTSTHFTRNRSQINNLDPPTGLFVSHNIYLFKCDFVSLDSRIQPRKGTVENSFPLASTEVVENVKIVQYCNGLLLCTGSGWPSCYYVFNSSTNLFKRLPPPDYSHADSPFYLSAGLRMAIDPTKSCNYKVVHAGQTSSYIDIQTYYSETRSWSLCSDRMDDPNITMEEYIRLEEEKARRRAIVFNDIIASDAILSCEPTVSPLNDKVDFRISFDESDDEDYTMIYDKNSFSYKIIYVDDLKTDSKTDNDKVNMPLFPSPEPSVSCIDDLDFFKDIENEFPAIVYNDALTSKSDFSTEPTLCP